MKNKFVFIFCWVTVMGYPIFSSVAESADIFSLNKVEEIPLGVGIDVITKQFGSPDQTVVDDHSQSTVYRYVKNEGEKKLPAQEFIFAGTKKELAKKVLHVYSRDRESSIKFWKEKYPGCVCSITARERAVGDAILQEKYIQIDANKKLEIKGNRVVTVIWEKSK